MRSLATKFNPLVRLEAFDEESGKLNVVIETPKGNRHKYKYDESVGMFILHSVLPAGNTFPFDFGFIPSTLGQDGDPLDVLLLTDDASFTGCLVHARLVGVLRAKQTENGNTERNDRLIAVPARSHDYRDVRELDHLKPTLLEEIQHFFVSYNEMHDKEFKPEGYEDSSYAKRRVKKGIKRFQEKRQSEARSKAKAK